MSRIQLALNVDDLGAAIAVETSEQVQAEIARLTEAGMFTEEEIGTTCCFAVQDKVWVTAPDAERWEVYTKLVDTETFSAPTAVDSLPRTDTTGCCSQTPAGHPS